MTNNSVNSTVIQDDTFNVTSEISFGLIKALWYLTTLISYTKPNRKTEVTTQQWYE